MARITVEDCLNHIPNRFNLVVSATKRVRQLCRGAKSSLLNENPSDKHTVTALKEIARGNLPKDDAEILNETNAESASGLNHSNAGKDGLGLNGMNSNSADNGGYPGMRKTYSSTVNLGTQALTAQFNENKRSSILMSPSPTSLFTSLFTQQSKEENPNSESKSKD